MKLEKGQAAPQFSGTDQNGNTVSLKDYQGKKLVIYFYPKDDTPGCTAQACDLRDNYHVLLNKGYEVIGISSDSAASHQKFIEKYKLPFNLIADEDKSIHEQFGVWVEKSMYGRTYMGTARTTFIIDEEGKIEDIIEKVKTSEHTNQIIK